MTGFILYMAGAAGTVFCLTYLTGLVEENHCIEYWPAVVSGFIWPIMGPIYGAYLYARIMSG